MARLVAERADTLPVLAEVFREHGFDGASLSVITERTGLGKGSLYHFFPGGKEEMAEAVLGEISAWFEAEVFAPLDTALDPETGIRRMFEAVDAYFHSGKRICLAGAFALNDTRDRFADAVCAYFERWAASIATALAKAGATTHRAEALAEETLISIQGALILARAMNDPLVFSRTLHRLQTDVLAAATSATP
ncbi:MAG: TetR/AcrR family transcriptional regulator [Silicimonas sp.]|jgi:TetR/AcrR family transcriptional repressor of lmrAB and yxaGH operons|uniref:TetR/AcrR family transcriptional regulator n=1 Tax=Roseitalea porphyridii TaxID=1852022 RepID=UPI0032EF464D